LIAFNLTRAASSARYDCHTPGAHTEFLARFLLLLSKTSLALLLLTSALLTPHSAVFAQTPSSLCAETEQTLLSCELKNNKVVSLCASASLTDGSGYIQYRYGSVTGVPELVFPLKSVKPKIAFKYFHDDFAKGDAMAVSFHVGAYRYSFFNTISEYGANAAGVLVRKISGSLPSKPMSILCQQPFDHEALPQLRKVEAVFSSLLPKTEDDVDTIGFDQTGYL
jgi:hypothetical protein